MLHWPVKHWELPDVNLHNAGRIVFVNSFLQEFLKFYKRLNLCTIRPKFLRIRMAAALFVRDVLPTLHATILDMIAESISVNFLTMKI